MIGINKYIKVALDTSNTISGSETGSNVIFVEALQNMNQGIKYESLTKVTNTTDVDTIYDRNAPNNTAFQFHNAFKNQFIAGNSAYYVCAINPNESEAVYRGGDLPEFYQLLEFAGYHFDPSEEDNPAATPIKGLIYGPENIKFNIFSDIELNINFTNSLGATEEQRYIISGSILLAIYSYSQAEYYSSGDDTDLKQRYNGDSYQQLLDHMIDINSENNGLKFGLTSTIRTINNTQKVFYSLVIGTTDKGEKTKINYISIASLPDQRGVQFLAITKLNQTALTESALSEAQDLSIAFKDTNGTKREAQITIVNAGAVSEVMYQLKQGNPLPLIENINAALSNYIDGTPEIQNFVNNLRVTYIWVSSAGASNPDLYFLFTTKNRNLNANSELLKMIDEGSTVSEPNPKLLEIMGLYIDYENDQSLTVAIQKGLKASLLKSCLIDALQGGEVLNLSSGVSKNLSGHGDLIENEKVMQYVKILCDAAIIEPTHMVISRTLTYDSLMNVADSNKLKKIANSFDRYINDTCMLVLQTNDINYQKDVVLADVSAGKMRNIVVVYDSSVGNYVDGALVKFLSSINYFSPLQVRNLLGLSFEKGISACNITTEMMEYFDRQRVNVYALLSTGQPIFQTGYTSDISAIPYIDMSNGINNMIRIIRDSLLNELMSGRLTIDEKGRERMNMIVSNICDIYVASGLLGDILIINDMRQEIFLPAYQVSIDKITQKNMSERTFPAINLVIHCRAYANTIQVTIRESTNSVITTTITE